RSRHEKFELQTFYGQLTRIYRVHFPTAVEEIGTKGPTTSIYRPTTFIFAATRNCVSD
ncbi:hypothetical protein C8J57DRAFT_1063113, partial [Mycena rebaudengoi]